MSVLRRPGSDGLCVIANLDCSEADIHWPKGCLRPEVQRIFI